MKNSFEEIVIPNFVFEDGSQSTFIGYLRSREPGKNRSEEYWRVFDDRGHYYSVYLDKRKKPSENRATLFLEKRAYKYKLLRFGTFDCKVNPKNGHLLVPHECTDEGCKSGVILFAKAGAH